MNTISESAYEGDIVRRLHNWRGLHLAHGGELFEAAAAEIERLREAIRRLAEQDATLSVCNGNVTVEIDATLTDAEREAIDKAAHAAAQLHAGPDGVALAATLRGLLERIKQPATNLCRKTFAHRIVTPPGGAGTGQINRHADPRREVFPIPEHAGSAAAQPSAASAGYGSRMRFHRNFHRRAQRATSPVAGAGWQTPDSPIVDHRISRLVVSRMSQKCSRCGQGWARWWIF